MSVDHFAEEIEVAERAAREAGDVIMALYGKDYRIEEKGKNNPVTTADLEANRKIHEIVLGRYPEDGWLSEENKDNPKRLANLRVWIVDPIDGTKEFIEGIPQFAVSIALVVDGDPAVGVVYNPVKEELYRAAKGLGATLNGRPIRVSSRDTIDGASLLISRSEPRRRFEAFAGMCRLEPVGSIAYRLALAAAGEGDGSLTFRLIHEWDICAGVLIVEEAGGMVMNGGGKKMVFNQKETTCRGVVASNEALAPIIQEMSAQEMSQRK
jgi:myo-inositol-1(or 4)-monophosphatase